MADRSCMDKQISHSKRDKNYFDEKHKVNHLKYDLPSPEHYKMYQVLFQTFLHKVDTERHTRKHTFWLRGMREQ